MEGTQCSKCKVPNKKATVRCLDCKEFLCDSCHESHNSWKVMKEHKSVSIEHMRSEWKQINQFKTQPRLYSPWGIALNAKGEVAVTSSRSTDVALFSDQGDYQRLLHNAPFNSSPIAFTPDERYLLPNSSPIAFTPDERYLLPNSATLIDNSRYGVGNNSINFYDSSGNSVGGCKLTSNEGDMQAKGLPPPECFAVDPKGTIVAGVWGWNPSEQQNVVLQQPQPPRFGTLYRRDRVQSSANVGVTRKSELFLCHVDGRLITHFPTPLTPEFTFPRCIATTADDEIVITFWNNTLQVTNYSGTNFRKLQPPPDVTTWIPGPVCCSKQGEIFVVNYGETFAVYKYLADGDQYLGCVIKGLHNPTGIAISADGQRLYVTEGYQHVVKIFQSP